MLVDEDREVVRDLRNSRALCQKGAGVEGRKTGRRADEGFGMTARTKSHFFKKSLLYSVCHPEASSVLDPVRCL